MIRRSSEYIKHQLKAQNQDIFAPLVIRKRSAEERKKALLQLKNMRLNILLKMLLYKVVQDFKPTVCYLSIAKIDIYYNVAST